MLTQYVKNLNSTYQEMLPTENINAHFGFVSVFTFFKRVSFQFQKTVNFKIKDQIQLNQFPNKYKEYRKHTDLIKS